MFQVSVRSKVLVLVSALLVSVALPAIVFADGAREGLSALAENPVIAFGVISALEEDGAADVIVTFELPPIENSRYADHPAADSGVHPLLFDLVAVAEPGSLRFEEAGSGFALHARMSIAALTTLGDNSDILAIELDPSPEALDVAALDKLEAATESKLHCPCYRTSTQACLQNFRWRVRVNHGGSSSKVATYSNVSAVFWTYGSTNWEILTKVIDGCVVNNKWWVFAAGASSVPFTVTVEDANFCPNYKVYSSASAGNPILDTSAFNCS